MARFRMLVSASSIQVVRGSQFVMSIPLRIWEPSRDSNGKILWSSRSRTDLEERILIDALDRAIRDTSDVVLNRSLLRALAEQLPSATAPCKRDDSPTAGLPSVATAAQRGQVSRLRPRLESRVAAGTAGVRLMSFRKPTRHLIAQTYSDPAVA